MDETVVSNQIAECIVDAIKGCKKEFMKIAFVGVDRKEQRLFAGIKIETGIMTCFFDDYEKAKEWMFGQKA